MPDLPPNVHQQVVKMLEAALADVQQLRAASKPPPGYLGFQLVEKRLNEAQSAVGKSADRNGTIGRLRTLDGALSNVGLNGDVAPATKRIRTALERMLAQLEAG